MQEVHQQLLKEVGKYLIKKDATTTCKLKDNEMLILKEYNKILADFSLESSVKSLDLLKKLWNESKEMLPLYAGSGIYPICSFAKIIIGEFMMNKATVKDSVLWNLLSSYTNYLILKDVMEYPTSDLLDLLKSTKPTNIAEIWLCTLWSDVYKLSIVSQSKYETPTAYNQNINVLNSDGYTTMN